jgi:uncharacterized membrane protein YphA (DoxX/SURF4 family)
MRAKTIIALVILRLVIGWHFLFEGLHKVHLWFVGESEISKPFSSEVYFREATGPLGPYMRPYLPNPDESALALLTPKPKPADSANWSPKEAVPDVVTLEWDAYSHQLNALYTLDEKQQAQVKDLIDRKKVQLGSWLTTDRQQLGLIRAIAAQDNVVPAQKLCKKTYPSGVVEEPLTTPERVAYYHSLLEDADFWKHKRSDALRKPVDKDQQARLRTEIAAVRQDLLGDVDKFTTALKDELADVVRRPLTTFSFWNKGDPHQQILVMVSSETDGTALPESLSQKYDAYHDLFVTTYNLDDKQKDLARKQVDHAKEALREWVNSDEVKQEISDYQKVSKADDPDKVADYQKKFADYVAGNLMAFGPGPFFGVPIVTESVAPVHPREEKESAYKVLVAGYDGQTSELKKALALILDAPKSKAYPPEPAKKLRFIDWLDMVTMWTLTVVGACLLLGLFSRTSGLVAMGFLVLTYLTYPPFPWLPTPPNTEGNPLFVNKNVIEFAALLVLFTVPSGRWFGLDALVSWLFSRGNRTRKEPRPASTGVNGHRTSHEAIRLQSNR